MHNFIPSSLQKISEANKIIAEYSMPLTLRQLYYRFVVKQLLPNTNRSYKNLGRLISRARESGLISYDRIVDRTRNPIKPSSWTNPKDFFKTVKKAYKRRLLIDQGFHLEVWCEKDALASVLEPITARYDVYLQISRGYPSLSAIYEASSRIDDNTKILYLGDFDPTGVDIPRDIQDRFEKHFNLHPDIEVIALTYDDIVNHKLPTDPTKSTDKRAKKIVKKYGDIATELDALPPDVLVNKIETAIKANINIDKYTHQVKKEQKDIKQIEGLLAHL